MKKIVCDYQLGLEPHERTRCQHPPALMCICERCESEDPFGCCLEHQADVEMRHERVFPNHPVMWTLFAALKYKVPVLDRRFLTEDERAIWISKWAHADSYEDRVALAAKCDEAVLAFQKMGGLPTVYVTAALTKKDKP